jgi:hypothetical protein
MRVWRHKNTAYSPKNIQPTVPYGGGSLIFWGCISHDCKLDLITIKGNLTGDQYIRDFLQPVIVPHFDNHPLVQGLCIWMTTPRLKLMSLHRKVQLAGYSLGYRLYFCVSKPSFGRRLHDAETCSRLSNGSCAMSLNSNHVVLSTMPNVFTDVGLPTVDV